MARLADMSEGIAKHLRELPCPTYPDQPWVTGKPLARRRIALVSTAGLHRAGETPFDLGAAGYRVIPGDAPMTELMISHISTNFDRSGFQRDVNVMFPLDRLRELAEEGFIGSAAAYHYSFMGATHPDEMEAAAVEAARLLKQDNVDGVVLAPV